MKEEPEVRIHVDKFVGSVPEGTEVKEVKDAKGGTAFIATTYITNIFGQDMGEGAPKLEAVGKTKEEALANLNKEHKEFNDSLWV